MRGMIQRIKRSIYRVLPRMVTDIIRYLLKCFLEEAQEVKLIV